MRELTRRRALLTVAAGTAAAAGVVAANRAEAAAPSRPASRPEPLDGVAAAARAAARRYGVPMTRRADAVTAEADVLLCRSWDRSVYLHVDGRVKGFVSLSESGLAVAAACQAAGRRVAVTYWGHDATWAGVGRFEGALVAMDPLDLADAPGDVG